MNNNRNIKRSRRNRQLDSIRKIAAESLLDLAIDFFGLTTDMMEAGYILPNGTLLDLSGRKEGGEPGQRGQDHRQVNIINDKHFDSPSEGMNYFMAQTGAIRFSYFGDYALIDMETSPTVQQKSVILKFIKSYKPEAISISLPNSRNTTEIEFPTPGTVMDLLR